MQQRLELLFLMVLACILRFWHIEKPDIGNDECFSLFYSQLPVKDIIATLFQGDNPPLWEILLHFWIMIFGVNTFSIRLLSAIFNVLTIIPIYYIGEKFVKKHTGFFAALFYTFSSFSIFLAHDGRVYSMLGFLSACSLYLFLNLTKEKKTSHIILLTIVNIVIMYSHYLAIWLIVMEFLIFLSVPNIRKSLWKGYLLHIASLCIAYLPVFPFLYARFLNSGLHGTWIAKCNGISDFYNMLCCFTNAPVPTVCAIVLIISYITKKICKLIKRSYSTDSLSIIFLIWVIPLLSSFIISFKIGFFFNRYFYFLLPAYLLSISAFIFYLFENKRITRIILYSAFTLSMIISLKTDSTKMRYGGWKGEYEKAVSATLELKNKYDAAVIIAPEWLDKQVVYYLDRGHNAFKDEGNPYESPVFASYLGKNGYYFKENYKQTKILDNKYIICIRNDFYDISEIREYLKANGYNEGSARKYTQMEVMLFQRP